MMLFIPSVIWPYLGIQLYCWLGMTFFLGFPLKRWLRMTFWGFRLKYLLDKLIWISSWLKRYLGDLFNPWLKQLSRNWLRINSRLKWTPRYWFRSPHDSKCFPIFYWNQLMTQAKKHLVLIRLMIRLLSHPCLLASVARISCACHVVFSKRFL